MECIYKKGLLCFSGWSLHLCKNTCQGVFVDEVGNLFAGKDGKSEWREIFKKKKGGK